MQILAILIKAITLAKLGVSSTKIGPAKGAILKMLMEHFYPKFIQQCLQG